MQQIINALVVHFLFLFIASVSYVQREESIEKKTSQKIDFAMHAAPSA